MRSRWSYGGSGRCGIGCQPALPRWTTRRASSGRRRTSSGATVSSGTATERARHCAPTQPGPSGAGGRRATWSTRLSARRLRTASARNRCRTRRRSSGCTRARSLPSRSRRRRRARRIDEFARAGERRPARRTAECPGRRRFAPYGWLNQVRAQASGRRVRRPPRREGKRGATAWPSSGPCRNRRCRSVRRWRRARRR